MSSAEPDVPDQVELVEVVDEEDERKEEEVAADDAAGKTEDKPGLWERFMAVAYQEKDGVVYYFNNTSENWGRILGALFTLYAGVSLFFWALLEAEMSIGTGVLWTFFVVFIFFAIGVAVAIVTGQVERRKQEEAERRAMEAYN